MADSSGWTPRPDPNASGQVEDEHFGARAPLQRDLADAGRLERVARLERRAVHREPAARHVHVGAATLTQGEDGALGAVEEAGVDARVLVDRDGALGAVGRRDQAQASAL